jgi:hypothetical protein
MSDHLYMCIIFDKRVVNILDEVGEDEKSLTKVPY